ncbi:hypothetical protein AC578_6775 [Pseudocercospora eumusae]|uniref:Microbial-type PARG catalytic domain-containing protein n=1 Tax=Pseudocercospora eumusae TaxID=321146 RepID=A0A139GZ03_9PEZI|nr:hypothetical protein AC578_6775 [Pseudocercospora eumusae]
MGRIAEREERERRARYIVNRAIPEKLRASPRAKHGVSQADLIVDPQPVINTPTSAVASVYRPDLKIRVVCDDSLSVASYLSDRPYAANRTVDTRRASETQPNVAVHSMASTNVRGGGFLEGANSQEEFLCHRTTLYASLYEEFYALPNTGGIFSPDILVFRDKHCIELPKRHRFFIDVLSAGITKHPDNRGRFDDREASCSCGVSYCDNHRDIIQHKMRSVLRMAQLKGTKKLVLGAWGVNKAMNHPVQEIAKLWRKVIAGAPRQRKPNAEQWEGIDEIIFASVEPKHTAAFEKAFEGVLTYEPLVPEDDEQHHEGQREDEAQIALLAQIQNLELRIEQARNVFSRTKMKDELRKLNHQLNLGRAAKAFQEDEGATENEDVEDDYVVAGYPASDDEGNAYYPFDGTTSDSANDSDGARSEVYEFRFGQGHSDSTISQDEDEDLLGGHSWVGCQPSPQFDPATGWFQGSIDQLSAHVRGGTRIKSDSISPRSPLVRLDSNTANEQNPVNGFLARFQRTDVDDQS